MEREIKTAASVIIGRRRNQALQIQADGQAHPEMIRRLLEHDEEHRR